MYADTATTPTALVALNLELFYGACEHHAISLSDAIQAFLQAPLEEETWVLVPFDELVGEVACSISLGFQTLCAFTEKSFRSPSGRKDVAGLTIRKADKTWRC